MFHVRMTTAGGGGCLCMGWSDGGRRLWRRAGGWYGGNSWQRVPGMRLHWGLRGGYKLGCRRLWLLVDWELWLRWYKHRLLTDCRVWL